jgi:putative restriction endonuclease
MRAYVGVTDNDWFNFLSSLPDVNEINFWQPGGKQLFKAINPGELFLFKLHYPHNFIVGGGIFAHPSLLPVSIAWESFDVRNGARNLVEMKERISKYRREPVKYNEDYKIGCILLEQPFFLPREKWIPAPADWKLSIVQGKGYDLAVEPGLTIWKQLQGAEPFTCMVCEEAARYGKPTTLLPGLDRVRLES